MNLIRQLRLWLHLRRVGHSRQFSRCPRCGGKFYLTIPPSRCFSCNYPAQEQPNHAAWLAGNVLVTGPYPR